MKTILSIQSQVSFGAVGNTLATMVAGVMGVEIAAVNTISLVAHPGYGMRAGGSINDDELAAILTAISSLGLWDNIGMVTTGYMAKQSQVRLVREAIEKGRTATPLSVLIDPAFGDHGRHYNDTAIANAIREQLLPTADIITPNCFEASFLSNTDIMDADTATVAGRVLLSRFENMHTVIITGIIQNDQCLDMLIQRDHISQHLSRRLNHNADGFAGGGDLFSSLLSGYLIKGRDIISAFQATASQASAILSFLDKRKERDITRLAVSECLNNNHL